MSRSHISFLLFAQHQNSCLFIGSVSTSSNTPVCCARQVTPHLFMTCVDLHCRLDCRVSFLLPSSSAQTATWQLDTLLRLWGCPACSLFLPLLLIFASTSPWHQATLPHKALRTLPIMHTVVWTSRSSVGAECNSA